jgi:hypothetical protein
LSDKKPIHYLGDGRREVIARLSFSNGGLHENQGRIQGRYRPDHGRNVRSRRWNGGKWRDGARGIDIKSNDGQALALTFSEDFKPEAGFSTRYTSDRGAGVATILSIT